MNREVHVRICGRLEVQFLRSTRRRFAAKGEAQVGSPHKSKSTETEHRGGGVRSREEGLVMGLDRRDSIVQGCLVANRQREELQE